MPRMLKHQSQTENEPRLIDQLDIPLGEPIELAVWSVKKTGIRCKLIPSQIPENWEFNLSKLSFGTMEERTRRHFEAGLRIAELSFGKKFHDLLPWSRINNRPYLRCLHGYGLCLWRSGKADAAREIFEKMLWLNPYDNQGARFLLADIDAGKSWQREDDEEYK